MTVENKISLAFFANNLAFLCGKFSNEVAKNSEENNAKCAKKIHTETKNIFRQLLRNKNDGTRVA